MYICVRLNMKPITIQDIEKEHWKQITGREDFSEMFVKIREKLFSISDVSITHRWVTNWHDEGLLIDEHEHGKWRKFCLTEYIWLKIVRRMREFSIPIQVIKKLKDVITAPIRPDYNEQDDHFERIMSLLCSGKTSVFEKESLNKINQLPNFSAFSVSPLDIIIIEAILTRNHYSLIIDPDGNVFPYKEKYHEKLMKIKELRHAFLRSYVSISLTEILAAFINEKDIDLSHGHLAIITDEESKLLNIIRTERPESLKIKMAKNKIELLELSKEGIIDGDKRLSEILMSKGYETLTVKTQNGKVVYSQKDKRIKLDNYSTE